jgi:dihydrofolate reductase
MTEITATTFVSLDGVLQAPGGPEEDTTGGFPYGGWSFPYGDEDFGAYMAEVFTHADAFLLGRRTYDIFASHWPRVTDPEDPIASPLNALPKYVASSTLERPGWQNTTVLSGDIEEALRKLKEQPGDEIQIHGSGALVRSLFGKGLIDLHRVLVFPVHLGTGARLFPQDSTALAFDLEDSRTLGGSVTALTLRPASPARFGSYALDAEEPVLG